MRFTLPSLLLTVVYMALLTNALVTRQINADANAPTDISADAGIGKYQDCNFEKSTEFVFKDRSALLPVDQTDVITLES
ncbi:hypothetical protein FB45DRAFT_1069005 [Roridomyces roridus]|uniref:Uncharacterized protein n=1 Tax=Roridomyces roridus TaxID=1738132 RepID=A0AAD7AZX3_9AGAR|nr:hypothetical protein FB45DRAFT_1069005 [Roridomyces roridus]